MPLSVSPDITPHLLTIGDVCARCRISRATVYRLLSSGALKARKVGTRVLIAASDLEEWEQRLPTAAFRPPPVRAVG